LHRVHLKRAIRVDMARVCKKPNAKVEGPGCEAFGSLSNLRLGILALEHLP
jgi:hypothetical protein